MSVTLSPQRTYTSPARELLGITRTLGVAGQVSYSARVRYCGDVRPVTITCTGSIYGSPGPVMMSWHEQVVLVHQPERFGPWFDAAWMRRFALDVEV